MREEILRISGSEPQKCIKCGKCSASCPSYDKMAYHPHQFVAMVNKGEIEELFDLDTLSYCLSCLACSERCPRGVEPAKLIDAVRSLALRRVASSAMSFEAVAAALDEEMPSQAYVAAFRKYTN